jgi:hypothetical protein
MNRKPLLFAAVLLFLLAAGCGYIRTKQVPFQTSKASPDTTPVYHLDDWLIARASMHNHTTFSDGCRSPEDLVQQARDEGIAVLAITDHREGTLCLGEKICLDLGGVDNKKRGSYDRYFEELQKLSSQTADPILFIGLETGPYFWNEGVLPYANLKGVHWHFTSYGIDDKEVYKKMPARMGVAAKPEPDPGIKPYQEWVDYMVKAGGMVFQAHPESFDNGVYGGVVHMISGMPIHLTDKLTNLTGVAVIPEGFVVVGRPGGEWDRAQLQYLAGLRPNPLWAWGEADYHCTPPNLRNGTTLFYLKKLAREDVLAAMKSGMMVALMGEDFQDIYVSEFSVGDDKPALEKIMFGKSVKLNSTPVIRFSLNKPVPEQEVRLIRSGKVIFTTQASSFEFKDDEAAALKEKVFYRVEVEGRGPMEITKGNRLFTNPMFVSWNK